MQRIMEPTLAALRVMLAGGRADPDPALLAGAWALAERSQAAASTQPEHRAMGLLWFALGIARLRRWEIQHARHALRHADRQLAAGGLTGLQARARAWRALAEAWYGDLGAAAVGRDVLAEPGGPAGQPGRAGAWGAGWDSAPRLRTAAAARAGTGRAPRPGRRTRGAGPGTVSLRRDDLSTAQRLLEGIDQGWPASCRGSRR